MSQPIRTGIIRCDTHGSYFAPLMAPHDPMKLQRPVELKPKLPYSWMSGGAHFYFYTNYGDPRCMTAEAVDGFEIVNVWDEHREAAAALSDILDSHPRVCDCFDQVSEDVDLVFIADCNGDGSDHVELATPGLTRGVATFVDKPLGNTVAQVKTLCELSRKHDAPLYSASIMRHVPGAMQFQSRLVEIGRADSGCIRGGGCSIAGQIHSVSLAQVVFGNGIREVRAMGPDQMGVMHLSWGDRDDRPPSGVVLHHAVGDTYHCAFHVSAYGSGGAILAHNNINDYYYPFGAANILKHVKTMVSSGAIHESIHDMVEAVAVVNAGRQSLKQSSEPVEVERVHLD